LLLTTNFFTLYVPDNQFCIEMYSFCKKCIRFF